MSDIQALAYLLSSSMISLQSYELLRLNRASNLRKEMLQLLDEWVDAETEARLAREILEWKHTEPEPKDNDSFSTLEPLVTNATDMLTGGAKFLCSAPGGKKMPGMQTLTLPKTIGMGSCIHRPRAKSRHRMRPVATARLALRLLERPSKVVRDDSEIFGGHAVFPVAV